MSGSESRAPDGYVRLLLAGADVVALRECADTVRQALASRTLYSYAARHPQRRQLEGRIPAYAVPLPDGVTRVVVRHAHHGGALAGLTRDLFLPPTRAPYELDVSLRLRRAGVCTPEIVGYATYAAAAAFRQSDVMTREVIGGRDLATLLLDPIDEGSKRQLLETVWTLLHSLAAAGARHRDLNMKNILLAEAPPDGSRAYVLDVDRVVFGRAGDPRVAEANLRRLSRSARKWRDLHGAHIDENDLEWLASVPPRRA